jgi:hypothetical protein
MRGEDQYRTSGTSDEGVFEHRVSTDARKSRRSKSQNSPGTKVETPNPPRWYCKKIMAVLEMIEKRKKAATTPGPVEKSSGAQPSDPAAAEPMEEPGPVKKSRNTRSAIIEVRRTSV